MTQVTIGLVIVALPQYDIRYGRENACELVKELKDQDVNVVESDTVVTSWEEARKTADKFQNKNIDLLLILCGTFSLDDVSTYIVKELRDIPLIIWALPEPPLTGGPLSCGSLLAAVMNGSSIRKMGKTYTFLYGNARDAQLLESINRTIRVIETIKKLRDMRIGMVGYRPQGFYACTFDELGLRNLLGPEIVHIDISEVLEEFKTITDEEAEKVSNDISERFKVDGPTRDDMINTSKLYLSIRKIVEKEKLTSMAIKCWPELKDRHNLGACFTLSRLNDEGIMSACEADIHGVITMYILHSLTNQIIYFTDLISIDEEKNRFLLWHCGSTPTTLAEDPSKVRIRNFSIKGLGRGVTTEFPVKPGRITIARLSSLNGNYRLFITGGEAVHTEMIIRGNPVEVKMDNNVRDILNKIVAEGFEHHYAVVYADIKDDLIDLCERLNIEPIVI